MDTKKCKCGAILNPDGSCDICDNRPDQNEDVPFADKAETNGS